MSRRAAMRTDNAFAAMKSYQEAPVSPIYYQGRPPDLVFQRSLNTVAKRHHIRFWTAGDGQWRGAATHDVAMAFLPSKLRFTHRIDPRVDRERRTVVHVLQAAGCVRGTVHAPRSTAHAGGIVTDGRLAIVAIRPECSGEPVAPAMPERPKQPKINLVTRRIVLETRHYLTRGNYYYLGFQALRKWFAPSSSKT
jgi:hypothetical protein